MCLPQSRDNFFHVSVIFQIRHNLPGAEGIAIDWIGRKLYWVDNKNDKMYVSELDGRFQKTLVETDMSNPRAIVSHPAQGYVIKYCFILEILPTGILSFFSVVLNYY